MLNHYSKNPIILLVCTIFLTDGYKPSHPKLYPKDMTKLKSYLESRTGAKFDKTLFFGLQSIIKKFFLTPITYKDIDEAEEFFATYFNNDKVFDREPWEHIVEHHGGYLPLSISAVPEGMLIPTSNVLMLVEATDEKCAWLVSYVEGLLHQVWYPCTVATQSYMMKKNLGAYLRLTGTSADLDWRIHDFGFRGSTSVESASIGAAAHLLNFFGSDTIVGDLFLRMYYNATGLVSGSIPASEHSTTTVWGEEAEDDFLENALDAYPTGFLAVVIDSYDPIRFIKTHARKHKDKILARDGKLIFRPDSGDPVEMILLCLEALEEVFGSYVNGAGYKCLNSKVGLIYGDGIDYDMINAIAWTCKNRGWAIENAFGSGGGLLQKVDRDTQRFAFKACYAVVANEERDVRKSPSSDPSKKSKAGDLVLIQDGDSYKTVTKQEAEAGGHTNILQEVFKNGKLLIDQTLEEIRTRCKICV